MEVIEWKPHPERDFDLSPYSFRYEDRTLVLVFLAVGANTKCQMTFPSPMTFRYTDELYLYTYSDSFPFMNNIAKGSAYIESFRESSGCETLDESVVHYAIFTWCDCFEIITMVPPQVTWEVLDPTMLDKHLPPPWAKPV
jgi:hypothetical protein